MSKADNVVTARRMADAAVLTMDGSGEVTASGIEKLNVLLGRGADIVSLGDLSSLGITEIAVDAGDFGGSDGAVDHVFLDATPRTDDLAVELSSGTTGEGVEQDTDRDDVLGDAGGLEVTDRVEATDAVLAVNGLPYDVTISGASSGLDVISAMVASHRYSDDIVASVYDVDLFDGITAPPTAWRESEFEPGTTELLFRPGRPGDGVLNSIVLMGDGENTSGLGLAIENADWLGSLVDARPPGQQFAFLATEGSIGRLSLRGDLSGTVVNGLIAADGWRPTPQLEVQQQPSRLTAAYSAGSIGAAAVHGTVRGDFIAGGDLNRLSVVGGDLAGSVRSVNGRIGAVSSIARYDRKAWEWVGGSVSETLSAAEGISLVVARGGDLTGDVVSSAGPVRRVTAVGLYEPRTRTWFGGSITGSIRAHSDIGSVRALHGTGIKTQMEAGGDLGAVMASGDIAGAIQAAGRVGSLLAHGGDVDADIRSGSRLGAVTAGAAVKTGGLTGGSVTGSIEAEGDILKVIALGGRMDAEVRSHGGNVGVVAARGHRSDGSGRTRTGDFGGSVTAAGWIGGIFADGDMDGAGIAGAGLRRLRVGSRILDTAVEVGPAGLGSLSARYNIERSSFAAEGRFGALSTGGDLVNSSVEAQLLSRVRVAGRTRQDAFDGDLDAIHAFAGGFRYRDQDNWGWISPERAPQYFGGTKVYAG